MARTLLLRRRRTTPGSTTSSPITSTRSTRAPSTRSRSATTSSSASDATARTSSAATSARAVPADIAPDELTVEKAEELLAQPSTTRRSASIRRPAATIVVRSRPLRPVRDGGARRGHRREAPDSVAVLVDVARDGDARGRAPPPLAPAGRRRCVDGEQVSAQNGRYGPYVKRGHGDRGRSRREEQLFTITLDEAQALLAEPKQRRRGRGRRRGPLRGARRRSGEREADRRPRRTFRPVRHGR